MNTKRRVTQDEIISYIHDNPGRTENQIMESVYGYFRSISRESNKKYAECLRRALRSGKIRREFTDNRYRYFICLHPSRDYLMSRVFGFDDDPDKLDSINIIKYNPKNNDMLKVVSKYVMITVDIPVNLGDITLDAEVMIHCTGKVDKCDWDLSEYKNIKLRGIEIKDFKQTKIFYEGMGIDLNKEIYNIISSSLTKDIISSLISSQIKFRNNITL